MPQVGTVLAGRYRIEKLLAIGGQGSVYQATDTRLDVKVAIKTALAHGADAAAQFHREARLLAALDHPAIVGVKDFFDEAGHGYMVMDFIDGRDLQGEIEARGPLPVETVLAWIDPVCDALAYLHAQAPPMLFRDLKLANLILDARGGIRMVDFGIACAPVPSRGTEELVRGIGTPGYAPLEQYGAAAGTGTDPRSDVYALGATLYALLLGEAPPPAPTRAAGQPLLAMRERRPEIPAALEAAILRVLALHPEDRPASVLLARRSVREAAADPWHVRAPVAPLLPPLVPPAFTATAGSGADLLDYRTEFSVAFAGAREAAEGAMQRVRAVGRRAMLVFALDTARLFPGQWMVLVVHARPQ